MPIACSTTEAEHADPTYLDTLLHRIALGERHALSTLYTHLSHGIYVYALSVVKNTHDAEDILQNSFLAIVRAAPSYRARGKAKAWIYTIVHNNAMQCLRDRHRTTVSSKALFDALDNEVVRDDPDDRLLLSSCMQQLSEEEQRIVILHAVSGFRHREIAAVLELPLSTVLSKYNRALKKLRGILEKG